MMTREEAQKFLAGEMDVLETMNLGPPEWRAQFREAIAALEAEKPLAEVALCPNCHGQKTVQKPSCVAGDQPTWVGTGTPLYPCPTCDAKGYIILPAKAPQRELCPNCYGTGIYDDQTCTFCDGERYVVLSAEEEAAP